MELGRPHRVPKAPRAVAAQPNAASSRYRFRRLVIACAGLRSPVRAPAPPPAVARAPRIVFTSDALPCPEATKARPNTAMSSGPPWSISPMMKSCLSRAVSRLCLSRVSRRSRSIAAVGRSALRSDDGTSTPGPPARSAAAGSTGPVGLSDPVVTRPLPAGRSRIPC